MKPILVLSLLFAASVLAQPKGLQRGAAVEGITEYRLDNGLRVLLFPDPTSPKITVNVTYLVGARHENYGETGMAHLLEHMLFKSTATRKDVKAEIAQRCPSYNGTTSFDRTNYYETCPATADNLEWALRLEADRMVNARIAQDEFDKEMTVVRNEYELGENSANSVLFKRVLAVAFDWHNYQNAPIGARSDIEHVPVDRLRAFYRRYYQPDNAVVTIAGKFDVDPALALVASAFGPLPKPERKLEPAWTTEPTQDGERTVTVRRSGDAHTLIAAYHVPAAAHPDLAAVEVLGHVLTHQPGGRLYKALVETKLATFAAQNELTGADPGLLMYFLSVKKDLPLEPARRTLFETLDKLAAEPPTAEEVDRAKAALKAQMTRAFNDSQLIALIISEAAASGDWRLLFLSRDNVAKVTPADVARVAKHYLKPDNRTVGIFQPVDKVERAEIPATPDIRAMVENYRGTAVVAAGEEFNPTPENVEKRARRVTLANGTRLVLLEKKTRGEKVIGRITLRAGDDKQLFGQSETAAFTWQLLMRGSAAHTGQQIADELSRRQARLTMSGAASFGAANFETTRGEVAAVLQLAAEIMKSPKLEEKEFDTLKARFLAGVEQGRTQPEAIASSHLMNHLAPYELGDRRAVPLVDDTIAALKKVTLDGVKAYHRDFFGAGKGAVITLVGDFDSAAIEKVLAAEFGQWTAARPHVRSDEAFRGAAAVAKNFDTPDKANAMFTAGTRFALKEDDPAYAAVAIGNYVFGQGSESRLYQRMRKKEGWSYGASAFLMVPTGGEGARLMAQAIVSPENLAKLEAAFREELARAVKDGFTAEEVANAKRQWLQSRSQNRAQDMGLLGSLSTNEYWGRTLAWDAALEKKVDALTADEVSQAFRQAIDPAKFSYFIAGDLKKAGLEQ